MSWLRVLSAAVLCATSLVYGSGELSGRRAPGFSLPDPDLKQHDLQDYRGKIVLIDLMKTDCPHCRTFSQVLERAKEKYGDKLAVLSIVTPPDNPDKVRAYLVENKLTGPILFDCGQASIAYMKVMPGNTTINLPHLFLIDAGGTIRNDFTYEPGSAIFESQGLFAELDRMLAAPAARKKAR